MNDFPHGNDDAPVRLFPPQPPGPPQPRGRWPFIGFIAVIGVLLVVIIFLLARPSVPPPAGSQTTPTPASVSTQVPQPTATQVQPTFTPAPLPSPTPAFPCDVDVGNWKGGSPDWHTSNGALLNDASNYNDWRDGPTIVAPCALEGIANYAVETTIQVIGIKDLGVQNCFGISVRGTSSSDGWQGYNVLIGTASGNCSSGVAITGGVGSVSASITPGNKPHTYRIEANDNVIKFFIDGGSVLTLTDNSHLAGSQVGLWSNYVELKVTSFKVTRL